MNHSLSILTFYGLVEETEASMSDGRIGPELSVNIPIAACFAEDYLRNRAAVFTNVTFVACKMYDAFLCL